MLLSRRAMSLVLASRRHTSTVTDETKADIIKVTVVGAFERLGQTLALLLKQSQHVDVLALHDSKTEIQAVAMELSHVDTRTQVEAYSGEEQLVDSLRGSNIVLMCAGTDTTPEEAEDELFTRNARSMMLFADALAQGSPLAVVGLLTPPVDSQIPLLCERLRHLRAFNPALVMGVMAPDVVRANAELGTALGLNPADVIVPVVGGCSVSTTVPVLSMAKPTPGNELTEHVMVDISRRVRLGPSWVRRLRHGPGDYLSSAHATARFVTHVARALDGSDSVLECALVSTTEVPGVNYCGLPVQLGRNGVQRQFPLQQLADVEIVQVRDALCVLRQAAEKGEKYAKEHADNY